MSHTIIGKLNKAARQHPNSAGVTFFVSLGEQNYNHQTKQKEWTNYDAALFAKDKQIQYYSDALVEGAVIAVSGKGLLVEQSDQYGPKLKLVDAQLDYSYSPAVGAPANVMQQVQPQQAMAQPQQMRQAPTMAQQQQQPMQAQPMQGQPIQQRQPMQGHDNNGHNPSQQTQQPQGFSDYEDSIPF